VTLAPYKNVKDSGDRWLGQIPAHWAIDRLKWSISESRNGIWGEEPAGDKNDIICVRVADFDRQRLRVALGEPTIRNVPPKDRAGRLLKRGDLLLEKSGGGDLQPVGCVVTFDESAPAVCSNFIARMRVSANMNASYWRYVHAAAYAVRLTARSINQTSGIQNLDQDRYLQERVPYPPLVEQSAIADFLDYQTREIDALILEQHTLIELLKEKRRATVARVVTRGLIPDTGMKDTGAEWLGTVPRHWQAVRLGALFNETAQPGNDELPVLSVSIHHGVSDEEYDENELERKITRSADRSKYIRVQPGDLVYNMMRAWQGGFGTVKVEGMVSPAYVVARPIGKICTEFVEQLLRTSLAIEELRRHSHGVTDFRLRLYWDEFKCIRIAVPPFEEQQAILEFIGSEAARLNALTAEAERAIALLEEHRAALISDAVTGKIDVRGFTVAEPEREVAA
jgi:type I restriction enzyme, S subunit